MLAFLMRRLLQGIAVMAVVALVAFAMFRFAGDPVGQMVSENATEEQRVLVREQLGLNDPLMVQFGKFAWTAMQGRFGNSYQYKRDVTGLILERMPATLELTLTAAVIAVAIGIPMGVFTALRRRGFASQLVMVVSLIGISLPPFLVGILMIYVFAVSLGWLPAFGRGDVVDFILWKTGFLTVSGIRSLIMPAITLALFQMTFIMRLVRSEMIAVLRADFIRFCRARGLSKRLVNYHHALKNTLVPVITIVGLQLGSMIAFAIITETVFGWPGMGQLFLQAVQVVDIPVMSAYLMMIAFFFVIINLVVDLLYYVVDPRLRVGGIYGEARG